MQNTAMLESGAKASESVLQNLLNQVFRCRHRHKTYPFTPRGEDQCYAVCLDCGQRLGRDLQVAEQPPRKTEARSGSGAPTQPVTAVDNSGPPDMGLRNWRYDLLWVGLFAVGLSGGLCFAGLIRNGHGAGAPAQLLPPPACVQSPAVEPKMSIQTDTTANVAGTKLVPMPAAPDGAKSGAVKPRSRVALSGTADLAVRPQTWRVQSKSPFVVLGVEAAAVLELSRDPSRLQNLVQTGSLFTVPPGTAIEVREVQSGVMRILILEGSMTGREGWAQASQIAPRYRLPVPPRD